MDICQLACVKPSTRDGTQEQHSHAAVVRAVRPEALELRLGLPGDRWLLLLLLLGLLLGLRGGPEHRASRDICCIQVRVCVLVRSYALQPPALLQLLIRTSYAVGKRIRADQR